MTDLINAVYGFLSQFGIPVYLENGIPEDAVLPYMTWNPTQIPWDAETTTLPVRLWRRSENYAELSSLADRIGAATGDGVRLPTESGYVYLCKGNPWAQIQPMQDSYVKIVLLNFGINTIIP